MKDIEPKDEPFILKHSGMISVIGQARKFFKTCCCVFGTDALNGLRAINIGASSDRFVRIVFENFFSYGNA